MISPIRWNHYSFLKHYKCHVGISTIIGFASQQDSLLEFSNYYEANDNECPPSPFTQKYPRGLASYSRAMRWRMEDTYYASLCYALLTWQTLTACNDFRNNNAQKSHLGFLYNRPALLCLLSTIQPLCDRFQWSQCTGNNRSSRSRP